MFCNQHTVARAIFCPPLLLPSSSPSAGVVLYGVATLTKVYWVLLASPHVAGLATYLMSRENLLGSDVVRRRLIELATPDMVRDPKGSPNKIAFNGAGVTTP